MTNRLQYLPIRIAFAEYNRKDCGRNTILLYFVLSLGIRCVIGVSIDVIEPNKLSAEEITSSTWLLFTNGKYCFEENSRARASTGYPYERR